MQHIRRRPLSASCSEPRVAENDASKSANGDGEVRVMAGGGSNGCYPSFKINSPRPSWNVGSCAPVHATARLNRFVVPIPIRTERETKRQAIEVCVPSPRRIDRARTCPKCHAPACLAGPGRKRELKLGIGRDNEDGAGVMLC